MIEEIDIRDERWKLLVVGHTKVGLTAKNAPESGERTRGMNQHYSFIWHLCHTPLRDRPEPSARRGIPPSVAGTRGDIGRFPLAMNDCKPSTALLTVEQRDHDLLWVLDVPGLGALWIVTHSNGVDEGQTQEGMAIFTDAEIGR